MHVWIGQLLACAHLLSCWGYDFVASFMAMHGSVTSLSTSYLAYSDFCLDLPFPIGCLMVSGGGRNVFCQCQQNQSKSMNQTSTLFDLVQYMRTSRASKRKSN
jgi:hypothetical protein